MPCAEWYASVDDGRRLSTVELKPKAFLAVDSRASLLGAQLVVISDDGYVDPLTLQAWLEAHPSIDEESRGKEYYATNLQRWTDRSIGVGVAVAILLTVFH
eukprot:1181064-Prorocentrum_minimum.AAC.3